MSSFKARPLVVASGSTAAQTPCTRSLDRVIAERQDELPRLDLGEVEHVVDEAEEMLAVALEPLQHLAHPRRRGAIDVVEDELGIAQDRIQGRAQFVAHIGEELRLVLARLGQFAALLLDLGEEARVLDARSPIARRRFPEARSSPRKMRPGAPAHDERADDAVRPQERHHQQRAEAGRENDDRPAGPRWLLAKIGDLDRRALRCRIGDGVHRRPDPLARRSLRSAPASIPYGCAQVEFARRFVEDIDRAGIGARELHRVRDNRGQHAFKVEGRVHRLRHLAEARNSSTDRAKFFGARAQFGEEARILDGDDRLVGEAAISSSSSTVERRTSDRLTIMTPIACPSRKSGVKACVRWGN